MPIVVSAILVACSDDDDQQQSIAFVDSVKLFEQFEMKKEYDKMIEADLAVETKLIDSVGVLLNNATDSNTVFRLRKDYYLIEQMYNTKFEQLSGRYTKIVAERLNEYIKKFAEQNKLDIVVSGGNGNVLYVSEKRDLTEKAVEFVNKEFEN